MLYNDSGLGVRDRVKVEVLIHILAYLEVPLLDRVCTPLAEFRRGLTLHKV